MEYPPLAETAGDATSSVALTVEPGAPVTTGVDEDTDHPPGNEACRLKLLDKQAALLLFVTEIVKLAELPGVIHCIEVGPTLIDGLAITQLGVAVGVGVGEGETTAGILQLLFQIAWPLALSSQFKLV